MPFRSRFDCNEGLITLLCNKIRVYVVFTPNTFYDVIKKMASTDQNSTGRKWQFIRIWSVFAGIYLCFFIEMAQQITLLYQ